MTDTDYNYTCPRCSVSLPLKNPLDPEKDHHVIMFDNLYEIIGNKVSARIACCRCGWVHVKYFVIEEVS